MDPGAPWHQKAKDALVRFWRSEDSRVAAVRDVVVAGGVVLLLLGGIWMYTGQSFPTQAPLVVVESGSMMHGPHGPCLSGQACAGFDDPAFSRVGTIDPGDLVLVKKVDSFDDVETAFGSGKRDGYGAHGDVIVYKAPKRDPTPVIHRAMLLVLAEPEGCIPGGSSNGCEYRIPETCDTEHFAQFLEPRAAMSDWRRYCNGSSEPISLDLERDGVFLSLTSFPCTPGSCDQPFYSGFITKGDNNRDEDQPTTYSGVGTETGIACCPIQLDWIVGKARGEIPWFGLIKLAIYGNKRYGCQEGQLCSDPTRGSQWTILRATAPADIWIGLLLSVGVLILLPIGFDHAMAYYRGRTGKGGGDKGEPPPGG